MKAKDVLKILKVTRPTLTSYVKCGKLKVKTLPNGMYDYDDDSVFSCANISTNRKCVIYARVSTNQQKNDLNNQIKTLTDFAISNGYVVETVFKDIASGLSYDRGDFLNLLKQVIDFKIKTVFITDKDRLSRVSFNMWKELFHSFSCEIIVANETDETSENEEKEIFSDIISLLHCFAMKMYSNRRKKKISLIKEDLENEISL